MTLFTGHACQLDSQESCDEMKSLKLSLSHCRDLEFRKSIFPKGADMGRAARISAIILASVLLMTGGCATVPTKEPEAKLHRHDRIVAIGDVHGSFSGLVSIMKEAALIDNDNRWIGGNALMVQDGDLLDRGAGVRNVMDLLMRLQGEAEAAGGKVLVIMGNHEAMNIFGSRDYVNPKAYASFAGPESEEKRHQAFERWQALFNASDGPDGEDSETRQQNWLTEHPPGFVEYTESMGLEGRYGSWLRRLPVMFRYGGTFFFHGGISPEYANVPLSNITKTIASEIKTFDENKSYLMKLGLVQQWFSMSQMMAVLDGIMAAAETEKLPASLRDPLPRLKEIKAFFDGIYETSPLMVDEGPLWFRGFAQWPDDRIVSYLPEWLKKNNAWRMVVAHTPRPDGRIQSRLDGAVFLIDTGMQTEYYKFGRASALEIRNDDVTAIYEAGKRHQFPPPKIDYGPDHVWTGPDGAPLPFNTLDDILEFLKTAEPVHSEIIRAGVTRPDKLLLKKDGVEINAVFRHESKVYNSPITDAGTSNKPRYFRDSYQGEIAAYEMNRLLGLNNMPPTICRTINDRQGTLQLWAEGTMTEKNWAKDKILPPDVLSANRQKWDMHVFDNLINNIDRNQGNILIDPNWRLILIDHTRTFARDSSLPKPKEVKRCSRGLWHNLRHLDEMTVRSRLSPYLSGMEIDAVFSRRDRLVRLIQDLIDRNGEENVLF